LVLLCSILLSTFYLSKLADMPLVRKMELSHPGEILKTEVIEVRGLLPEQAAELLGISHSELLNILDGKASVKAISDKIARVFGGTAAFWERLQTTYDLDQSKLKQAKK
jgi:addiction module HigA family antidote